MYKGKKLHLVYYRPRLWRPIFGAFAKQLLHIDQKLEIPFNYKSVKLGAEVIKGTGENQGVEFWHEKSISSANRQQGSRCAPITAKSQITVI